MSPAFVLTESEADLRGARQLARNRERLDQPRTLLDKARVPTS